MRDEEPKKNKEYPLSFTIKKEREKVVAGKVFKAFYSFLIPKVIHIPSKIQRFIKYLLYKVIFSQITPQKYNYWVAINSSSCGYVYAYLYK